MHNAARYALGAFAGAAIISGVGIGIATAGNSTSPESPPSAASPAALVQPDLASDFIARLATKLGITEEELRAAIEEVALEQLEAARDSGIVPPDIADHIREQIENGIIGEPIVPEDLFENGILPPIPGFENLESDLEAITQELAAFLDTTEEEIRDFLRDGGTLAQLAEDAGHTAEEVGQFLLERYLDLLDDERIPQVIRDQMRTVLERLIDLYVEGRLTFDGIFGEG